MHDPDPRTVQRARRGDLLAFEDLVREFQADAFRFAWHLTRDRQLAEDVTQEAFLRAFRFLTGFRGDQKFGSWLFSIVRNCAMDGLRRERRSETPWDDQRPSSERRRSDGSRRARGRPPVGVGRAPGSLPPRRGVRPLVQETADVLGVAVGTVKSRMFRARQALCLAIADEEEAT